MKVAIRPDVSLFDASFNGASKRGALTANHLSLVMLALPQF